MFKKVPYIKYFQGINFKNYLNGNIHDIYFQFPGTWVSVAKVTYNDYICTDFIYTHNTKGYLVYVNAFKKYPYDTLHINSSKDIIFHFQKLKDVTKIANENGYKECLKLKDNVIALLNSLEPILDVEQNEKKKFSFQEDKLLNEYPYIGKNGPNSTPLFTKCFGGTTNHNHNTSYNHPINAYTQNVI